MAIDIAARINERRKRRAPCTGVNHRSAGLDLFRDIPRVTRPEPDLDVRRSTFHGIPAAAVGIEVGAIGVDGGRCLDATASVVVIFPIAVGLGGGTVSRPFR